MTRFSPIGLFHEARRRRVFQLVAMYILGAFVALQVADLAFPGLSIAESAIQYVWIGAFLGLPFALFFGWRFDIVDGRILRTAAIDGSPGLPVGRGDKLTLAIMTAALVAICIGLVIEISRTDVDAPIFSRTSIVDPNSVAVLPFRNLSGAPENEYLADGVTETLLHALAQATGLKVTARTSVFFYKGKDIDVREIAAELGVGKILEGSVQQSGDKIRIVAQLIEADTGFHLWSNTYDRDMGEIFAIQDAIASNVAIAILATMTASPSLSDTQLTGVSTTNLEAYQKYLQGLEQARISSNVSLPKAEALFLQALAVDPEFFEARKELAYTYWLMTANGTLEQELLISRAKPVMERLLAENPADGLVIAVDARLSGFRSIDIDDYITRMIAAAGRNPSDTRVYSYLARMLWFAKREDEAIDWLNHALAVDPNDYQLYWRMGTFLDSRGDNEAAIDAYERVTEINPQWASGHSYLAWAHWDAGDYVAWYQGMSRAAELDPLDNEMELSLAAGLLDLGLFAETKKHLAKINIVSTQRQKGWTIRSLHSLVGGISESRTLTESYLRLKPSADSIHMWPAAAYVSASIEAGLVKEALATLEEIEPGVATEEFFPASRDEFYVQFWATIAWAQGKEVDEVAARLDELAPAWSTARPGWEMALDFAVPVAFLRGDLEEASRHSIEVLPGNPRLLVFIYRHLYPFNVVAAEPALAALLSELEDEFRHGGEAVRAYIAQNP